MKFEIATRMKVEEGDRIQVRSTAPMLSVPWTTETARVLADLRSLDADLAFVVDSTGRALSCHARRDREGRVRDAVGLQAYFSAAIVAYGRCYDPPRSGLGEGDVESVGLMVVHRKFIDLRNLHVAHHIGDFWERPAISILLRATENPAEGAVIGSGFLFVKSIAPNGDEMKELSTLANGLRSIVRERLVEAEEAILAEANRMSLGELYALAARPKVERTHGPSTSVPRRRKK